MLPIESVLPVLRQHLRSARHVVLIAPPGAGKTTHVPLALLNESWLADRKIVMLEPRRLAARAAAQWMAALQGEPVGKSVGYRMRFDTNVSDATRIEVVTEGILTRLLQHDPSLSGYGLVIFDEFHERSVQADLGLALTLDAQRVFRPDLRILVMSATLDGAAVADLLGGAPVVLCEGRLFPVETHYLERPPTMPVEQAVPQMIGKVLTKEPGSLLVFLPGMAEIRRVERRLLEGTLPADVIVTALHGELSQEEQERAIAPAPAGHRKVVLSSAIAETSLTIEGVRVVIDSGLMRVPRYDPRIGLTRLDTITITQDSADQRRGRAGRVEPGACYRLWTAAEQKTLLRRRLPEILDTDLTSLVLDLAAWGTADTNELAWLDPPPAASVAQARDLLGRLSALDETGKITAHGRAMVDLPVHPRLAHMLLRAVPLRRPHVACEVAALLGEWEVLRGPPGWRNADLRLRWDALRGRGGLDPVISVDHGALSRVRRAAEQFARHLRVRSREARDVVEDADRLGLLLAYAYPDRVGQRRPGGEARYLLANGRGARFQAHDPLSKEPYVVVAQLADGEEWARIDLAATITMEDLNAACADQIRDVEFVIWNERTKAVQARKQRRLGALVLHDQPLPQPDPERVRAALLEGVRKEGIDRLPWTDDLRQWRARVAFLRRINGPASQWPDVSDRALSDTLHEWLGPFLTGLTRLDQVQRLDLTEPLHALMDWRQRQELDRQAPTHVTVMTGSRVRLKYEGHEAPILAVRLQELFGCRATPRVAGGRVPVLVHLLSPAGRPVQVTQDLAGFWNSSYQAVRKELRGRYPKHPWPEDPLTAQPTRRTKK